MMIAINWSVYAIYTFFKQYHKSTIFPQDAIQSMLPQVKKMMEWLGLVAT